MFVAEDFCPLSSLLAPSSNITYSLSSATHFSCITPEIIGDGDIRRKLSWVGENNN